MQRNALKAGVLLVGPIFFLVSMSGCFSDDSVIDPEVDSVSQATEGRYSESEIRDYEGIRLDPSVGPRDNSISGIQQVDLNDYSLRITGLVSEPVTYGYEEVLEKDSYKRLTTLYCVEGWEATILWEGIRIEDLLDDAGVTDDGNTVIFHCVDGYTTSMPLETIRIRDMIIAYSSNGITLPQALGFPFIVVAEDKLGYKWARWVDEIEISNDQSYEGYWESRGYSNDAEIDR